MKKIIPALPSPHTIEDSLLGSEIIRQGKVAAVVLAGGQGTRLGFSGPKGCFPIASKSLFQIFSEKVPRDLQFAVMCSTQNRKETENFFIQHGFFGLKKQNVLFFNQSNLPLADLNGKWLFDEDGKMVLAPDGNGSFYSSFYENLFSSLRGIEYISIFPVDNPLAEPFCPSLIGYHVRTKNEVSAIAVKVEKPEKMGIWILEEGKPVVLEYLHFDGHIENVFANVNLFCMDMAFIQKAAKKSETLPFTKVEKQWMGKKIIKLERFIFDAFPIAERRGFIALPKESCYSPLKGKQHIELVKKALAQ
ncbi:MAG TPA: UTP--glucose-1-phosphate uridylyltransferase [Chlamydiales bacterium]|nr:UTP--glucose-1-phosphate uridylyltransferase [Chlamydiales bacterium]